MLVDLLWRRALKHAAELSREHTPKLGTRTLDVLHVATALVQHAVPSPPPSVLPTSTDPQEVPSPPAGPLTPRASQSSARSVRGTEGGAVLNAYTAGRGGARRR